VAKGFGLLPEYVLHQMSYANAMIYCATLPTYDSDDDEKNNKGADRKEKDNEIINADDPANRKKVKDFFKN